MRFIDLDHVTMNFTLLYKKFDSKYSEFFQDYDKYSDVQILHMIWQASTLDFTFNEWNPSQRKYVKFQGFDKPAIFDTHEDVASFIGSCLAYIKCTTQM